MGAALRVVSEADQPYRIWQGKGTRYQDSFRAVRTFDQNGNGRIVLEIKPEGASGWREIIRDTEAKGCAIAMANDVLEKADEDDALPFNADEPHEPYELLGPERINSGFYSNEIKVTATWRESDNDLYRWENGEIFGVTTAFIQVNIPDALGEDNWCAPRGSTVIDGQRVPGEWKRVATLLATVLDNADWSR